MKGFKDGLGRDLIIKFSLGGFKGDIVQCEVHRERLTSKFIPRFIKKLTRYKVYFGVLGFDGLSRFSEFTEGERNEWVRQIIETYNEKKLLKKIVQHKINHLNQSYESKIIIRKESECRLR